MSTYPEPLVARSLGVKKKLIVDTRKGRLVRGADWALEGAQVVYTATGLKNLCAALGLEWPGQAPAAAPSEPEGAPVAEPREEAIAPAGEALEQSPNADQGGGRNEHPNVISTPPESPKPTLAGSFARRDLGMTAGLVAEVCEDLAKKSEPVAIEITGVPGNRIIVHGRLEGQPVTVRVKSNLTFIPGLWIRATPINDGHYYAQVGNPPRWKGDRHGFTKPQPTP